ncbi:hypothetical protein COLO4_32751 [Corchorus olitorius]|uniref:Uncharacterized protein n=1 Tax=Corchorus olitorius TaxID=93759 RepID=A0A1R3GYD9_9ROSI|nr:hypothetical protein COLO4_32751 [Corchorus olitorius]
MDHVHLLQDIDKLHKEAKQDQERTLKSEEATREVLEIVNKTLKIIIELLNENIGFSSIFDEILEEF